MTEQKKCPVCGSILEKTKNKLTLKNPKTKKEKIVHVYNCTRCGYATFYSK